MDNKLIDIEKDIKLKKDSFRNYLEDRFNDEILDFIGKLEKHTSLYLFSGIIRDFFVAPDNAFRDIDLVYDGVDDVDIESLFLKYKYEKNSFGGYKIHIGDYIVDIWNLNETWGLKNGQLILKFNRIHKLPETTFFNFSSIVYSLNENEFIIGKPFLKFLKKKEIDLVLEENPYPELCIVNTIYYQRKLNLKLSRKLKKYVLNKKEEIQMSDLQNIQIKHFNTILFTENDIRLFFNNLKE